MNRKISEFAKRNAENVLALYSGGATLSAIVIGSEEGRRSVKRGSSAYQDIPVVVFRSLFFPWYIWRYL
nr:hypothetical protein MarFTME_333 [Marseillevirus futianmevirus]